MKIFVVQCGNKVGDLSYNSQLIERYYLESTDKKADICLLPELMLTGYLAEDLFQNPYFHSKVESHISKLIELTTNHDTILLLPTPIKSTRSGGYHNSILAIQKGRVLEQFNKTILPNYALFDEKRYFIPGTPKILEINGIKIGVPICEDLWHTEVIDILAKVGAELLLIPNASPYEQDKFTKRLAVVQARFNEYHIPIIYCNQILGHDGIIFDGRSFCYDGSVRNLFPIFKQAAHIIEVSNSVTEKGKKIIEINDNLELGNNTTYNVPNQNKEEVSNSLFCFGKLENQEILKQVQDDKIKHFNYDKYSILPLADEQYGAIILGLRDYVNNNGFKKVLIGISGGIDSALVATLAVDALGSENVMTVMLASRFTSESSIKDAEILAKLLQVKYRYIDIDHIYTLMQQSLAEVDLAVNTLASQNLQARIRGNLLMTVANSNNMLLLTTGNKSELATGYATLYGDMCGAFNPIKDLYKTAVYKMASFRNSSTPSSIKVYNQQYPVIPEGIITRIPTAELAFNQKDTDSLPEYELLDEILDYHLEQNLGLEEIIAKNFVTSLAKNYTMEAKIAVIKKVLSLVKNAEFKRQQAPIGIKLSKRDLQKERRYPITNGFF